MSMFEAMVLERELYRRTLRVAELEEEVRNLRLVCDAAEAEWNRAETELAAMKQPCVWRKDEDNWWQTGCGDETFVKQGDFCPTCGHPIEVAEPVNGEWDGSEEEASRDWDNPGE